MRAFLRFVLTVLTLGIVTSTGCKKAPAPPPPDASTPALDVTLNVPGMY
jgi:hypothetical protein